MGWERLSYAWSKTTMTGSISWTDPWEQWESNPWPQLPVRGVQYASAGSLSWELTSPRLLRGGPFEGWLPSSSVSPGNEASIPYSVNFKGKAHQCFLKGKECLKKSWMKRQKNPQPAFIFSPPGTSLRKCPGCRIPCGLGAGGGTSRFPGSSVFLEFTKLLSPGNALGRRKLENKRVFTNSPSPPVVILLYFSQ